MKKILLGTTTLFGAALLAGAASAETPKVTIGGYSDFQVGMTSEDNDAGLRPGAFRSDDVITFRIDAKSDAGLGYGAAIDLHADVSQDQDTAKDSGGTARRTYVYLDGMWGRLQGGSDLGVTNTMKIDASSIARATGGVDGDFTYFVSGTTGQVLATPDLILDYGSGQLGDRSSENINKVSYYTPRFAGFQLGVSYLFDTNASSRGQALNRSNKDAGQAQNVVLGAINYDGKFDAVTFGAAATGEWGNAEDNAYNNLRTWNAGAKAGFMGFSLAGSYGSLGDSLRLKSIGSDSSNHYWTVGGAYEFGPFGASVTYLDSQYDTGPTKNDFSNIALGVDYKLAPGLTPYAELDFVKIDPAGTAFDNDATVFIAGTQLQF